MKYIVAILSALCFGLGSAYYITYKLYEVANAEKNEYQARYELIKTHIENQNSKILEANKGLNEYKNALTKIKQQYHTQELKYKTKILQVKTCEDSIEYLRDMLNDLNLLKNGVIKDVNETK